MQRDPCMAASSEVHPQPCMRTSQLIAYYSIIMYDTDRTGHAPHSILRRTACVHRSRDTVRRVALFVLLLVTGFSVAM
jgi:hypothetical protein